MKMPFAVKCALVFVTLFVAFALFGQWLSPHEFRATSLTARLQPPGTEGYPLGTDARGRALLASRGYCLLRRRFAKSSGAYCFLQRVAPC